MINIEEFANQGEIFDGHYKLLRPLSTDGATADVWLALDTNTIDTEYNIDNAFPNERNDQSGMLVAIKIYRPKNALDIEGEQRFRDEYKIVYECRHENLLQPTSFSIFKEIPYLVLPYCKYGSSEQLIGKKHTEEQMWKFIADVAAGLAKLHSNQPQIIHQDIKPANILIDNSQNFSITDFGISSSKNSIHGSYYNEENSGTLAYMAPERFDDAPKPIPESDIWAFGATLCEIFTGNVPFGEEGGKNQDDNSSMPALQGLPTSIRNLILACLQKDPKKRPTARQLVEAARKKQFPPKSTNRFVIPSVVFTVLILLGGVFVFIEPKAETKITTVSPEEVYASALSKMNSNKVDELRSGLHVMDSLSDTKYIPAMYEMAFTYGWYNDAVSVNRKKLLGIEMDSATCFPKSKDWRIKVKGWYINILEQNDSTFANYNAKAAYHLASYYGYGDMLSDDKKDKTKADYEEARKYLNISRGWALIAEDKELLGRINSTIEIITKLEQKQKNNE